MRRNRVVRIIMMLPFAVAAAVVFGFLVMALWNWLLPPLFGVRPVGFWQALGILVLSRILFGRFGGGRYGGNRYARRRFMRRWSRMTPEEREKFRQALHARCGGD